MLMAAKNIAKAPKMLLNVIISPLISTTCNIAPTMTIPEIAFVTDMRGVCSAEVTFQTT
jgi:hypothetical protein